MTPAIQIVVDVSNTAHYVIVDLNPQIQPHSFCGYYLTIEEDYDWNYIPSACYPCQTGMDRIMDTVRGYE